MGLLADAFRKIGVGKTTPKTGGIYRLKDSAIHLPDSDLAGNRTKHDFRTVLVISNQTVCTGYHYPCVVVVPMSHMVESKAETDLVIPKGSANNLEHDSRLLFAYVQPVLKSDLEKEIGILTDEEWEKVAEHIVWNFDR